MKAEYHLESAHVGAGQMAEQVRPGLLSQKTRLSSQHLLVLSVTTVPGDRMPSFFLLRYLAHSTQVVHRHTYRQNTYRIIKIF